MPYHVSRIKTANESESSLSAFTFSTIAPDFPNLPKSGIILTMDVNDPRVEENLAELAAALAKTNDSGFIVDFLHCLLTPAEVADVAARWALVKDLKRKVPHREIAKNLGISLCKITRGSRVLKKPGSAFARIFAPEGQ